MSFTNPQLATQQAFRRQKKAMFQRLRHNFVDKCIALLSGVLLFVFVQTEHNTNPPLSRPIPADIIYDHQPGDLDPETLQHQVTTMVTGPRLVVESLRPGDVHATADLGDKYEDTDKEQTVLLTYSLPHLPADVAAQIHVEGPLTIKITLHTIKSREFRIRVPDYSAPAGFHFGLPTFKPATVVCSGRKDRTDRIERVVVNLYSLATLAPNAAKQIQGDVDVVPLDAEGNIVQNVNIDKKVVHIQLPLIENELERNVTISTPMIPPNLPWVVDRLTVDPQFVKIKGMKDRIDQIYTISTDPIDLHDVNGSISRQVPLPVLAGITVYDLQNRELHTVTVTATLHKLPVQTTPNQSDPQPNGQKSGGTPGSN